MRSLRWTLPLTTAIALTGAAAAQATITAVTLNPSPTPIITRVASDGTTPYGCPGRNSQTNSCIVDGTSQGIGYHDCVDDTQLTFSLSIVGLPDANNHVEIWAGASDCTQAGATHNSSTGLCWPVAGPPTLQTVTPINIRVADIVGNLAAVAPNIPQSYTPVDAATACGNAAAASTTTTVTDDAGNTTFSAGESTVTIYFMVFANSNTSTPVIPGASYAVKVKLVGPNPCTNVVAGAGDGIVIMTWDPPAGDTTIQGFNLYAAPAGTVTSDGGTQLVCDGGGENFDDAGNPILDDAGNETFADASCITEQVGPTIDTCSGSSGSIDVSNITCGSTTGDGGTQSSATGLCTQVIGTTNAKGTITGLTNEVQYDTAVAAFDQFGNTGSISSASCGTPKPIKDFWTTYNDDGGNAFCALSVIGSRGGGIAGTMIGVAGIVFLRRRKKR